MKGWQKFLLFLVVVSVLIFVLRLTVFKPKPIPVTVFGVERGVVRETITNSKAGTLKAETWAKISPEISGLVVEIFHREGARVERDTVLLRIQDDLYRAALQQAEADLGLAESRREEQCLVAHQNEREYLRNRALLEKKIASEERVDLLEYELKRAEAACLSAGKAVEQARAAVVTSRVNLEKAKVRAPFSGIIAEMNIEVGEVAMPTSPALPVPPIFDLFDDRSLYVSAPMDEVDVVKIKPGQQLLITLDSHDDRTFSGHVKRVAPYVSDFEEQNRTVEVEAVFDELPDGTLHPGVSADVEIILESKDDILRLPTFSLTEGGKVYVLEEGVLVAKKVTVGLRNWEFVEVVSGLREGELVVTSLDVAGVEEGVRAIRREAVR